MKREKTVARVCAFAIGVNLILFFTKLYISLSANSISIFSDAINNLSDSLSCALALVCMLAALKLAKRGISYLVGKIEQVLSFLLAIVVVVIGFSFAYSSIERLMYPAPVWFSMKYFSLIALTALTKLVMFFVFRSFAKKTASPVIKVMQADSITDFAVTTVTLITFTMTRYTEYTVDAFAGLIISAIIIVQAIRLIKENLMAVLNLVEKSKREAFENAVKEVAENIGEITFSVEGEGNIKGYVTLVGEDEEEFLQKAKAIEKNCFEKTGIKALVILSTVR